ncbi:Uncharacterised protein [Mycobacterium tuberculosis]|nr:Uncharacterised protein [Mycobacterium tuberculosis]CPA57075.1 Uncharacterised protein [Mycobacterium tuberculosis]
MCTTRIESTASSTVESAAFRAAAAIRSTGSMDCFSASMSPRWLTCP